MAEAVLVKTWIRYGLVYPLDYIDIWGMLTLGSWYPLDRTHAGIYQEEGERQGYLLTNFQENGVMNMKRPASKWPEAERMYEKIATEKLHQDIPVISLFFAPATYCWVAGFYMGLMLYQRRYGELLPPGLLFFYWGTVMLGPASLVRYLYPVILTVPFIICRGSRAGIAARSTDEDCCRGNMKSGGAGK